MVAFLSYVTITLGFVAFALLNAGNLAWVWSPSFLFNIGLTAVASLLSFEAYRRERHYRHVFFALWIVFGINALTGPVSAIAQVLWDATTNVKMYVWHPIIGVHVALAWSVTVITVGYLTHPQKRLLHTAIAGLVVIAVSSWLYTPYLQDPLAALAVNDAGKTYLNLNALKTSTILVNSYSLLVLLAFYVHKYRTDRPIGAYADALLFLFGIALTIDTAEYLLSDLAFEFLVVSQWAMMVVYGSMVVCLALRLKFKSQTIADYYESQCISDDPLIDRRIGRFDRLILRAFFDTEKVGKKIFLGTGSSRMRVRRTPTHVARRANG